MDKAYEKLESRSNKLAININTSINTISAKIETVIEDLKESLGPLMEPISRIESIVQEFDNANITTSFAKATDLLVQLDNSLSGKLEELVDAGKRSQNNISNADNVLLKTEKLLLEFKEIDKDLDNIFRDLNENIKKYINYISDTYKEILKDKKELMK